MSGKLTAKQVRETLEKHWHDLPAEYGMPEATALPEYSYDWQAIADELSATLGGGKESNYENLFGTPERMARTMIAANKECETAKSCYHGCPFSVAPTCPRNCWPDDYDALLEWLEQEADA